MKTIWVVYSRFVDDPSIIRGIFEDEDTARECLRTWDEDGKDIYEIELNKIFDRPLELN